MRFNLILRNDAIKAAGGIIITPAVRKATVCTDIHLDETDFCAEFNQMQNCWIAQWNSSRGQVPELLCNKILKYQVPNHIKRNYEAKLQNWIHNGWLVPYPKERLGPPKGLLPLMAGIQHNKHKVCPVMDYREHEHVDMFIANADVHVAKLKE